MNEYFEGVRQGFRTGARRGWSGFVWMLKILVPISFLTSILAWSGLIERLDFAIEPVMGLLGLPGAAAVPLLVGMGTNIYGGIAAMAALPFSREEMTLIAVFLLICHNLVQEGVIQSKSGLHGIKATAWRLGAAVFTVLCISPFLQGGASAGDAAALAEAAGGAAVPFLAMLQDWAVNMLRLSVKIFLIIMSILILMEILKALGWIEIIVRALAPVLRVLGLSRRAGILWMTAAVFGLAYGAAVIVEEARQGELSREELESLQVSIGINHSLVEDPALFLSLGLGPFWLWIPRLITAMLAVRLIWLWRRLRTGERLPLAGKRS
jgi:spore maturation protein SpmB